MQRDKKQNWAECHAGDMACCECVLKRQTTGRVHLPKCEFFTRWWTTIPVDPRSQSHSCTRPV